MSNNGSSMLKVDPHKARPLELWIWIMITIGLQKPQRKLGILQFLEAVIENPHITPM
jgi:hypothetical protein